MTFLEEKPRLRWPLEVNYFDEKGESYIVLRDSSGVAPNPAVFPLAFAPILARLDGNNSIASILEEGAQYGVTEELLQIFVSELDQLFYLDTPASVARMNELRSEFEAKEVRDAALAGVVYSADPKSLRSEIADYLKRCPELEFEPPRGAAISAVMSPHIDYARGWQAYAAAHKAFAKGTRPDYIFLLGTAHQATRGIYHLSDKDFATPLGNFPSAKEVVAELCSSLGREKLLDDHFLHKEEHSLELQLPFLAHAWEKEGLPKILPVLVGSFQHFLESRSSPAKDPEVADFVAALAEITAAMLKEGKKLMFYAGVDFAHIGPQFGDQEPVTDAELEGLRARDSEMLDVLLRSDEEALFAHICEDGDQRRVCGYPSLYTMLATMKAAGISARGHCLDYRQAVDSKRECIVSFASAAWCS